MSAVAFAAVVASTHYVVAEEECPEMRMDMRNEKISVGVRMLYDIVLKVNNNLPMIVVKPQYTLSTDDTVVYIFEGRVKKKEKFRLVSRRSKKSAGTNSIYTFDESNAMRGMRVKLTFTFSAVGTSAPLLVSVVGLTERELPEDVCIPMWIEGLCVEGDGVNLG